MKGEFFIIKWRIEKYLRDVFTNSNDKILDIGSGYNHFYHKFMKGRIVCFDIEDFGKTHVIGDADSLPFKKNSFDKVIMVNSLYYFKNPLKVIKSASNMIKSKGKLVIVTPFLYPIHDKPSDKYRFTEFGLKELLKEDFRIEEIEPIGGFFNLPAVILHSIIKGLPLLAPKPLKNLTRILAYVVFYIPYILAQFVSILDVFDRTRRFPTYYISIATKK